MRLFFGVAIPQNVRTALMARVSGASGLENVRFVSPDSLHVTLRFIGDTRPERQADLEAAAATCQSRPSFSLSIKGAGTFPSDRRPRAFWADLGGDAAALSDLAGELDRSLDAAGFPSEGRPFVAHLTLGRARPDARPGSGDAAAFRSAVGNFVSSSFQVKEFHLYQSQLGPVGARYAVLRTFPLA